MLQNSYQVSGNSVNQKGHTWT